MFFGGMEVKHWLKMGLILWSYIFKSFLQFRGRGFAGVLAPGVECISGYVF